MGRQNYDYLWDRFLDQTYAVEIELQNYDEDVEESWYEASMSDIRGILKETNIDNYERKCYKDFEKLLINQKIIKENQIEEMEDMWNERHIDNENIWFEHSYNDYYNNLLLIDNVEKVQHTLDILNHYMVDNKDVKWDIKTLENKVKNIFYENSKEVINNILSKINGIEDIEAFELIDKHKSIRITMPNKNKELEM